MSNGHGELRPNSIQLRKNTPINYALRSSLNGDVVNPA